MAAGLSSRSKLLVTLALNKKLKQDIDKSKLANKKQNIKNKQQDDPEYCLESEYDSSSESSSGSSSEVPELDTSHVTANSEILTDTGNETGFHSNYDMVKDIVEDIVKLSLDCVEKNYNMFFTKKGNPRKRQRFDTPASERKKLKRTTESAQHKVKGTCNSNTCKRKCSKFIDEARQEDINRQYWNLSSKAEQSLFVNGCVQQISKG